MTAIEFIKSKDPNFSLLTDTNQSHSLQGWINLMEEYAQHQVKKCDLANVGERSFIAVSGGKIIHQGVAKENVDRIQVTFDAIGNKATVANYYWVIG